MTVAAVPLGQHSGRGWAAISRPGRYALTSVLCGGIAQLGLILAYGVFGWDTFASVQFSLAVSVVPSYVGSRVYVWSGLSRHSRRTETAGFLAIAIAGSAAAAVLTDAASQLGHLFSHDRTVLTGWVSAGSVLATVVVWATRYVVLDRFLFAQRRSHTAHSLKEIP